MISALEIEMFKPVLLARYVKNQKDKIEVMMLVTNLHFCDMQD
jgi:hypothetical protein